MRFHGNAVRNDLSRDQIGSKRFCRNIVPIGFFISKYPSVSGFNVVNNFKNHFNVISRWRFAIKSPTVIVSFERAINFIGRAKRVEFYGFGASGSVAADAQHKFFRLQVSSAAYTDPHIQHMSAISLGRDDVVVAISQSGQTLALLQSVRLAMQAGATVIGLAPRDTALSQECTIAIHVNMEEDEQAFAPVSSRIAHLVVIDVLATGVALKRKPALEDHLHRLDTSQRVLRRGRVVRSRSSSKENN